MMNFKMSGTAQYDYIQHHHFRSKLEENDGNITMVRLGGMENVIEMNWIFSTKFISHRKIDK